MNTNSHKQIQQECSQWAEYYAKIDFPRLADSFGKAAKALQELIDAMDAADATLQAETAE